jgi:hypothetical protein
MGWDFMMTFLAIMTGPLSRPFLSHQPEWVGIMLIIIAGVFLMALAIGLAVRANAPDEVPPTHAHDEPPGASHHHGPVGDRM